MITPEEFHDRFWLQFEDMNTRYRTACMNIGIVDESGSVVPHEEMEMPEQGRPEIYVQEIREAARIAQRLYGMLDAMDPRVSEIEPYQIAIKKMDEVIWHEEELISGMNERRFERGPSIVERLRSVFA